MSDKHDLFGHEYPIAECPHSGKHFHGTVAGYSACKCRCTACKTVNRRRNRAIYAAKVNRPMERISSGELEALRAELDSQAGAKRRGTGFKAQFEDCRIILTPGRWRCIRCSTGPDPVVGASGGTRASLEYHIYDMRALLPPVSPGRKKELLREAMLRGAA